MALWELALHLSFVQRASFWNWLLNSKCFMASCSRMLMDFPATLRMTGPVIFPPLFLCFNVVALTTATMAIKAIKNLILDPEKKESERRLREGGKKKKSTELSYSSSLHPLSNSILVLGCC